MGFYYAVKWRTATATKRKFRQRPQRHGHFFQKVLEQSRVDDRAFRKEATKMASFSILPSACGYWAVGFPRRCSTMEA